MQVDNNDDAKHRSSQPSDPGDSGSTSQPSSKLRDKLQKLAEWRIDPASIEFQEHAPEFRGGHATVSQAFLVSTNGSGSIVDNPADISGDTKSGGGIPDRKAVAVKRLNIEDGKDKERILGLALREAGFLTELNHKNVIRLEGFVEDLSGNRVWLVFPWATDGNLKDFVASANWEIPERIWLINDVARGVEYLHNRDPPIYHGDLKSANVLVNPEHRAVITDFGSARRLAKKDPPLQPEKKDNGAQLALVLETEFCEATNTMTLTGNQFTLRWAAPELLKDDEPGLWSDIWALGWIFYEVMTNSIPFQNVQKDSAVFVRVIQGNLPSVADHASMVLMRALYSLMITCWNIDPSKRPTAEDCRKSPKVIPARRQGANMPVSRTRSPELLIEMGEMHRLQNDYINATKLLTEALSICTDTANNPAKADALFSLAEVNRGQYNYNEAMALYSEAAQLYTDIGSKQGSAYALLGLAEMHRVQDKYSEAITFFSEVVQICTEIGDEKKKADALWGLAEVHRLQDEYGEAIPLFSEVVQICTKIGDKSGRADALWGLAEVHRLQKQYSQALQLFSETLQIRIEIGDRNGRAWALWSLADVNRDQDQHEDARRRYEQAAGVFEEIGNTRDAARALKDAASSRQKLKAVEAE